MQLLAGAYRDLEHMTNASVVHGAETAKFQQMGRILMAVLLPCFQDDQPRP